MKKITENRKQGTQGQRELSISSIPGPLIDIMEAAKAVGLMVPVSTTQAVWEEVGRVDAWCDGCDEYEVGPDRAGDLLQAWLRSKRETLNRFTMLYHLEVYFHGLDESPTPMTLKSVASRDEEGNFSLTLMLPDEEVLDGMDTSSCPETGPRNITIAEMMRLPYAKFEALSEADRERRWQYQARERNRGHCDFATYHVQRFLDHDPELWADVLPSIWGRDHTKEDLSRKIRHFVESRVLDDVPLGTLHEELLRSGISKVYWDELAELYLCGRELPEPVRNHDEDPEIPF